MTKNIERLINITYKAGEEILKVYESMDVDVEYKKDNSPLTEADKKAHKVIEENLKKISDYPVLSEEGKNIPYKVRKNWEYFWLVDPLDGTKEFIKKNGQFTVNIALIHRDKPVLGLVYAPVMGVLYYGDAERGGYKIVDGKKSRLSIHCQRKNHIRIVASKSHLNKETLDFIELLKKYYSNVETVSVGSSLKICLIAEGKADIYPRLAPTMEWDTAAAHAVLNSVGGKIVEYRDFNNLTEIYACEELKYNKKNLKNPYFIALRTDVF